jgi:hypothetical protein
MSEANWYWMNGTPYCPACVDCDTPAVDAADCTRGPSGRPCACCGYGEGEEEQEDPIRDGWIGKDGQP